MPAPSRDAPRIITELPGPRARALMEEDHRYLSPSYTRGYPLVVERGEGAFITDVDGNRFLDFTAGIAVCATGHCHPEIVKTIAEQSQRLIHMSGTDFYYEPQIALARKIASLAPGSSPKKVFFSNSGTEAVEAAYKLARYNRDRTRMVAFFGAFHGRTFGALSLTASKVIQKDRFSPLVPGVSHVPYAYCYRCDYNLRPETCGMACVDFIDNTLFRRSVSPKEVAAIVVEPIQGEGGYVVPPSPYYHKLRELADRHGILLIADEVQSGMGRTGKMFAIEHWGVEPDIICLAKGVASGLPLGLTVARADLMTWPPGSHASTFGGNPIACAVALKTIELLEGGLMKNAEQVGGYLRTGLLKLMDRYEIIGDVRGKGLMVGVELVEDRTSKKQSPQLRDRIVDECFYRGLLLLGCGDSNIRFCPPLTISTADVDTALEIVTEVVDQTVKGVQTGHPQYGYGKRRA